jgi:hypothetical protein
MKKLLSLLLVPFLLSACHSLRKKEELLSEAGFRTVRPATIAQTAHLNSLPQGHIIPVTKNGETLFLLADAKQKSLFIGNQSQYQTYKQLGLKNQLSEDKLATKSFNADSSAEWSAWGGIASPLWSPDL